MIDRLKFDEYVAEYGQQFFVEEIIDVFFMTYETRMAIIRQQVSDRNYKELENNVHSIRSAMCNFWDPLSINESVTLEMKARACESDGLDDTFQRFETSMQLLMAEVKTIRQALTSSVSDQAG